MYNGTSLKLNCTFYDIGTSKFEGITTPAQLSVCFAFSSNFRILLIGDKQPYGSPPQWASSLWWPNSCMTKGKGTAWEGIDAQRHLGASAIVLNDGHSEVRKNDAINPPENPGGGSAKSLKNSRYWDPLQHSQE